MWINGYNPPVTSKLQKKEESKKTDTGTLSTTKDKRQYD
jgi:hypothetical protein